MQGRDWGVLQRNERSTWLDWRKSLAPFHVLDRLIDAGLGDVPQVEITEQQFEKAMNGVKCTTC